jgi:hypothetical protein
MLDPEDEEIMTLRNFGKDWQTDTAPHTRRLANSTLFLFCLYDTRAFFPTGL